MFLFLSVALAATCLNADGSPSLTPRDAGMHWAGVRDYHAALPCFEAQIDQNGETALDLGNLGSVHLDLARALAEPDPETSHHHLEMSTDYIERALATGEANTEFVELLTRNFLGLGRFGDAKSTVIAYLPSMSAGPVRDSLVDLFGRFAIEPWPEDYQAYEAAYERARSLGEPALEGVDKLKGKARKSVKQSLPFFDEALKVQPRSWPAWWMLGKAHLALGDTEAAQQAFQQAYTINPVNPDIVRELVYSHILLGNVDEAVASDAIVKLYPEEPALLANHALVLLKRGDTAGARAVVDRALELAPGDAITQALSAEIAEAEAE